MLADLYYDPRALSAFSTYKKVKRAAKTKSASHIKTWLQKQEAYTLHRQVRKRFPRNPHSVNNILEVFECDLVDVQALSKHNEGHRYLLTVIDVFSKFLHIVPLKSKTGNDVIAAFRLVLQDPKYLKPFKRPPVWVCTDKGKEFLNSTFQNLLKHEGIEFQVCRNPNIKCSVVERAQRTIRDKLYKFFTLKNTYRYIEVLEDFVAGYNTAVHSSTGMAPVSVTDSDVLAIWKRMQNKQGKVRIKKAQYSVGQHVRISKEKINSPKVRSKIPNTEFFVLSR